MNTLSVCVDLEDITYTLNRVKTYGEMPTRDQFITLLSDVEDKLAEMDESRFSEGETNGLDIAQGNLEWTLKQEIIPHLKNLLNSLTMGVRAKAKLQSDIEILLKGIDIR